MDSITIDGVDENDFRRTIETMLRLGHADEAAARLRNLLEQYAGDGRILPERFLTVTASDVSFPGWDQLATQFEEYDRPEHEITAICLTVIEPDGDSDGKPTVETRYFCDDAYPFSEAERDDLLEGYSIYGCEWQGNYEDTDETLSIAGIDDLFEFLAKLEDDLFSCEDPGSEEIRAGSLGSCYLSVLVHQALLETVRKEGLPRDLCVLAGSDGVYPFFDAPVMSSVEYRNGCTIEAVDDSPVSYATEEVEDAGGAEMTSPDDTGSLLKLVSVKTEKKPVLALDKEELERGARLEQLAAAQQLADPTREPSLDPLAALRELEEEEWPVETAFAPDGEEDDEDSADAPPPIDWGGRGGNGGSSSPPPIEWGDTPERAPRRDPDQGSRAVNDWLGPDSDADDEEAAFEPEAKSPQPLPEPPLSNAAAPAFPDEETDETDELDAERDFEPASELPTADPGIPAEPSDTGLGDTAMGEPPMQDLPEAFETPGFDPLDGETADPEEAEPAREHAEWSDAPGEAEAMPDDEAALESEPEREGWIEPPDMPLADEPFPFADPHMHGAGELEGQRNRFRAGLIDSAPAPAPSNGWLARFLDWLKRL